MSSPDIRESSSPAPADVATGDLVSRASEQLSNLVRDEIRLAQAELAQKGRRAGLGIGLFGGAGAIAWFGVGTFVAAAVLGLGAAACCRGRGNPGGGGAGLRMRDLLRQAYPPSCLDAAHMPLPIWA